MTHYIRLYLHLTRPKKHAGQPAETTGITGMTQQGHRQGEFQPNGSLKPQKIFYIAQLCILLVLLFVSSPLTLLPFQNYYCPN